MRIKLLSTWSHYSSGSEVASGIKLVTHQQEVLDAICDPAIQVVFDTALTGDGKTLAGSLPIFQDRRSLGKGLFAYPTNELIRDQLRQFGVWSNRLDVSKTIGQLDGLQLAEYMRQEEFSKSETLKNVAHENEIVLTNPDIFTLIHRLYYNRRGGNAADVAQYWLGQYRYIVFDEFHIFGAPQIANVLDGIAFIRANATEKFPTKFLFLSATPDELLLKALKGIGVDPKVVRGSYEHGLVQSSTYRRILHEVELELVANQQSLGGIENWVSENCTKINQFFKQNPDSKGLLIANSVFAAKRIVRMLKDSPDFRVTVGENTGLTGTEVRKESMNAQLIVATSTVDVGVDFAINFLVFESLDSGTFIQRLGRLGRHNAISEEHQLFSTYKAIALVPDWVREKFATIYSDGSESDRESFFRSVREAVYQKPQEFQGYLARWGTALSTLRFARLSQQKQQYQTLLDRYSQEAGKLIGKTPYWEKLEFLKNHKVIVDDLETFRGAGRLDVWIHDPDTQAVKSMNLLRLLAGTDFQLIEEDEARQISERFNCPFYKNKLGLYVCIDQYLSSYEKVQLTFSRYLDDLNINEAQERKGFQIKAKHPAVQRINDRLELLPLTTFVADSMEFDISALRRSYKLPTSFDLQIVCDCSGTSYPVAFGQDALLLDSLLYRKKSSGLMMA